MRSSMSLLIFVVCPSSCLRVERKAKQRCASERRKSMRANLSAALIRSRTYTHTHVCNYQQPHGRTQRATMAEHSYNWTRHDALSLMLPLHVVLSNNLLLSLVVPELLPVLRRQSHSMRSRACVRSDVRTTPAAKICN